MEERVSVGITRKGAGGLQGNTRASESGKTLPANTTSPAIRPGSSWFVPRKHVGLHLRELLQPNAPHRLPQLQDAAGFDLANAFARDAEQSRDFVERFRLAIL